MTTTKLDRALTYLLVAAALAIAGVTVRREFGEPAKVDPGVPQPVEEPLWREIESMARFAGPSDAAVRVVQFGDYQCPFCRAFHFRLDSASRAAGIPVAEGMAHFLLPTHRFARPAAMAAECAGDQGKFRELNGLLFERQDSIGVMPWGRLAARAGVPDTSGFLRCLADSTHVARIDSAMALGVRIEVRGTPTVFINGRRFTRPPTDAELRSALSQAARD